MSLVKRCFHSNRDVPVIKVPKYLDSCMPQHEKKKRLLLRKNKLDSRIRGDRQTAVITSRHIPQFNFYLNQKYPQSKEVPIASAGWKNGKHKGDEIVFHPTSSNPHFLEAEGLNYDFNSSGLSSCMVKALNQMNYHRPTSVQLQAIPEILAGKNVMCSAETGCGKTMAYLAPLIDSIALHKEKHGQLPERHPYGIVLLPTRELVYQIGGLAKDLGTLLGVGVAPIFGGKPRVEQSLVHTGYDLVVTTLGLIEQHMKHVYSIHGLQTVVLDEADTLLDDSFNYNVWDLIHDMKFKTADSCAGAQMCLVSATIPRHLEEALGEYLDIDSFSRVQTENLHRVQPHVKHVFFRIHKFDRTLRLLELLSYKIRQNRRIMIFTNDRKSCKWLYHHLLANNIDCILLSKAVDDEIRLQELERFQRGEVNVVSRLISDQEELTFEM